MVTRTATGTVDLRSVRTARRLDYALDHVHFLTALFVKEYFRHDPLEEFESLDLGELMRSHEPVPSRTFDDGWSVEVSANGESRFARVHWRRPPKPGRPIFMFHHGGGSIPHDKVFNRLIPETWFPGWNVGCIEGAYHRSLKSYFDFAFDKLDHMLLFFAASVQALESVARWGVQHGSPYVAFCGVSVGGIVSTLHLCHYGSANLYLPIFAGLDLHHLFLVGPGRSLAHKASHRAQMECYKKALDFTPLVRASKRRPCFPLLAKHDKLVDYVRARRTWNRYPVTTIARGHASGVVAYHEIAEHILTHLPSL